MLETTGQNLSGESATPRPDALIKDKKSMGTVVVRIGLGLHTQLVNAKFGIGETTWRHLV